jgi:hypothetical protein
MEVGFPKNLAQNSESLEHARNVSIILDISRPFSVSSRCPVCITGSGTPADVGEIILRTD